MVGKSAQSESIRVRVSKRAAELWMGISGKRGPTAAVIAIFDLVICGVGAFLVPYMMLRLAEPDHMQSSGDDFLVAVCLFFGLYALGFLVVFALGLRFSARYVREFVGVVSELPRDED